MPKEDYLLKYLEKLGRTVALMMGLRKGSQPDEAIMKADFLCRELFEKNLAELSNMSVEEFIEIMQKEAPLATHWEGLTQIMHETAKSYDALNDDKNAQYFYEQTLRMYRLLNEKDKTFSFEREMIIAQLAEKHSRN